MLKSHNHAFWVYGVIVGLAIREALAKVIPHAIPILAEQQVVGLPHIPDPYPQTLLEAVRLSLFLGLIIRFYLGSAQYFDEVYCSGTAAKYECKNYGMDFLLGLLHFIGFFVWSETLVGHDRFAHSLSTFLIVLGGILGYDLIWWLVSVKYSSMPIIRVWAILNLATMVVSYLILLFLHEYEWWGPRTNETIALIPVGLVTIADFGEMFSGKNLITSWIVGALGRAGVKSDINPSSSTAL